MPGDPSENELVEHAVAGDETALERLMMMHHGHLAAEFTRRLPEDMRGFVSVDDVLQETYVIVFREIKGFRPRGEGAFYRWVEKIAEHRLFDLIKAERAAKRGGRGVRVGPPSNPTTGSVVEWLGLLAVYERTPSRSAALREAIAVTQKAFDDIKDDYREALRLRYMEGLSVAEAATRMNRTEGAVCLLCHRGLKRMKEAMGNSTQFFGPWE